MEAMAARPSRRSSKSRSTNVYCELLRIEGERAANATDADTGPPIDGHCQLGDRSDPLYGLDDPWATVLQNLELESCKIERALGALLAMFVAALR